jgi:hypothetical protein
VDVDHKLQLDSLFFREQQVALYRRSKTALSNLWRVAQGEEVGQAQGERCPANSDLEKVILSHFTKPTPCPNLNLLR